LAAIIDCSSQNHTNLVGVQPAESSQPRISPPEPPGHDQFFHESYQRLYRKAYTIMRVQPEAEDLVHDAHVRLREYVAVAGWEVFGEDIYDGGLQNPRSDTGRRVLSWLMRATIRLAQNARKSRIRRDRKARLMSHLVSGAPSEDPIEAIIREEERRLTDRILSHLPARHARVLFLIEMGLSWREIARALGVANSSVGPMINRARKAFLAQMRIERNRQAEPADRSHTGAIPMA
jgi:RNA polymerase sigma factor (sigma-70 family)